MRRFLATLAVGLFLVATTSAIGAPAGASGADQPVTHEDFRSADFSHGPRIDNRWLPYPVGTQYVLEGTADRGNGPTLHRVTLVVTDLVKQMNGVRTRVLYDVDTSDGQVNEVELAFQAQDNNGNVWLLGEYPEEFVDGNFNGAPNTWISGVEDALAGVMMRDRPRPGTSSYYQALIESIGFADLAEIVGFERRVCVKVGCFGNVLVIREQNTFVPNEGYQLKYYAAGVGNIRIDFLGGAEQETLELVEMRTLNSREMTAAREAALRLDRRAYRTAAGIYGGTRRAERER